MVSLNSVKPGNKVEILEVRSGMGLLNRLASMGIYPGSKVQVVSTSEKGPVIIAKNGARLGLGFGAAKKIFVRYL